MILVLQIILAFDYTAFAEIRAIMPTDLSSNIHNLKTILYI